MFRLVVGSLLLIVIFCNATSPWCTLVKGADGLRIASYNIRSGSGMDDVYNLSRTAEAIRMMNVDLIGLQEVDQYTDRHPLDDQPKKLAMLTGLTHYVFGKFRDFENGSYGVAILSRYPIERSQVFHFQKPSGNSPSHVRQLLHEHHHAKKGRQRQEFQDRRSAVCAVPKEGDYCQGAVAIQINTGEQRLWFATTHLGIGFNGAVQAEEAKQLAKHLALLPLANPSGEDMIILTGDFNSVPHSDAIGNMLKSPYIRFVDGWAQCGEGDGFTFNSAQPFERIDYAFIATRGHNHSDVGFHLTCNASVPVTQASDHRPLFVSLQM